ncbi:MAG: tRNA pseudouridine(13) synthase TruD [Candidatus Micrarchaeia archaeon]
MEFLSDTKGTGGIIKKFYEDFVVKEITSTGIVLNPGVHYKPEELNFKVDNESQFTTFIIEKRNWDTIRALLAVAKKFGRGKGAFAYCGTKDKFSVSVQLASIHKIEPKRLEGLKLKDIQINGAWKGGPVELGNNIGNAFEVMVREGNSEYAKETLDKINGFFPNYFDRQRFGYRLNNFDIGLHIIKGEFEEAVISFLTNTKNENDEECVEARNRLKDDQDYEKAREYFPKHLRYEHMVIEYLSKDKNYANALRRIPRGISIMFIHAVESAIFNVVLSERIKNKDLNDIKVKSKRNNFGFPDIESISDNGDGEFPVLPLIGYETEDKFIDEYQRDLLEKIEIDKNSFKISHMPELSMKGSFRTTLGYAKDISLNKINEDFLVKFSLQSGSYATIFINEITKTDILNMKDVSKKLNI